MRWLWNWHQAESRMGTVPGAKVLRTTRGTQIIPSLVPGGKGSSPVQIKQYVIAGTPGNNASIYTGPAITVAGQSVPPHFVLVTNPSPGGPNLPVLLAYKLWAIPGETIDTVAVSYGSYGDSSAGQNAQTRSASTINGGSETQVIVPRFLCGDIIWCAAISSPSEVPTQSPTGSTPDALLDINADGRAWAASTTIV
jgi:hypothetical protein